MIKQLLNPVLAKHPNLSVSANYFRNRDLCSTSSSKFVLLVCLANRAQVFSSLKNDILTREGPLILLFVGASI